MIEVHGLDTPERVCFYEQDFYVLSNFSAFAVRYDRTEYATAEHCYQTQKFLDGGAESRTMAIAADRVRAARSAHDAFKIAQEYAHISRVDWASAKLSVMRAILISKVKQHEYVRRKLLATGDRELVENSWRDAYWGWGPNRDGQNMLGKLWMEVRAELRRGSTGDSK